MTDMNYEAYIFDLDGTLLDTLDDLTDGVNHTLASYGMPIHTIAEICSYVGNGMEKLIERSIEGGHEHPQFDAILADFKSYYGKHCNEKTKPYPGILSLLQTLKEEGKKIAIVSNKGDFAVKELCEIYFKDYVKVAIGESKEVRKKPAPDTVFTAMKELGVKKEDCVYIGDSEVDIQTARNAGIPCISVLWGFRKKTFLQEQGASHFVEQAEEILQV